MALTKLTKPRARWATFKLKVAGAVERLLSSKLLGLGISPEDFGAVGDGTANDTQAVLDAITYSLTFDKPKRVVGEGTYAVSRLVIPASTKMSVDLTNFDNNDILLLNGDNINLGTTSITPKTGFTGWCLVCDDTQPEINTNLFSRLSAQSLILNCLGARSAKAVNINLTKASCSFWDLPLLDIKGAAKGFVVKVKGETSAAYFNSNTIGMKVWAWVDEPLILHSDNTGSSTSEVANNTIHAQLQPQSGTTLDGAYLSGGVSCTRNVISGIVWDWANIKSTTGKQALTDVGKNNTIRDFPTDYVSISTDTKYQPSDVPAISNGVSLVPTNDTDSSVAGRQDNILYYADKRGDMTVTQSHAFDFSTTEKLFDTNHYDAVRWNVSNQTEERWIDIDFNGANHIMSYASATSLFNGIPLNVKIEFKNSGGTYDTFISKTGDISQTKGRGAIKRAYGVRFTFSAPQSFDKATGTSSDATFISLTSLFVKSLTGAEWSPHMSTFQPVYYGDLRVDEVITLDVGTKTQTKAIRVLDVNGTLIGYMPIYV